MDPSLLAGVEGLSLDSAGLSTTAVSESQTEISVMSSSSGTPESWISSFCSLLGHEYFAEVSEDFIEDDFNLTGLQNQVPMYKEALEMILNIDPEDDEEDEDDDDEEEEEEDDDNDITMRGADGDKIPGGYRRSSERRQMRMASDLSVIESSAELLYGLIHQRYITSRPGIQQMADKYELQHFGACPRVFCNSARVLPVGCNDIPGQETVKLFCPSCLDVYIPPNSRFQSVDGAFFGTTFGCLFFMTFPEFDVSAKGDPLNLASTNPIFGVPLSGAAGTTKSRSSSLTSTPVLSVLAAQDSQPLPPPPVQPATINGTPTQNLAPGLGLGKMHESRIYGFRVSERSKTGPRMKWLRMRPVDITELDESARWRLTYGEDPEELRSGGASNGGVIQGTGYEQAQQVARRKKAPIRSRRRGVGAGVGGGGGRIEGVQEGGLYGIGDIG